MMIFEREREKEVQVSANAEWKGLCYSDLEAMNDLAQ